jgi:phosphohistidine phosphatase
MMPENIILWRHAQAHDIFDGDDVAQNDMQRALTDKGQRQADDMAKWLKLNLLKPKLSKSTILLCSPALRAYQTADALQYKINIHQALKPSAGLNEVLACLAQVDAQANEQFNAQGSFIIVGHQPWLGQLAAYLLGHSDSELAIKKGAVWWLRLDKNGLDTYNIHTVQTPSLL